MATKPTTKSPAKEPSAETKKKGLEFHYQKGPDFRTIHCDGAIGGITPRGLVHIAIFSERHAIPRKTVQEITEQNTVGAEIVEQRETIGGIVRQMEVDLFMGEDTARSIRDWLNMRLLEIEAKKAQASVPDDPAGSKGTSKVKH